MKAVLEDICMQSETFPRIPARLISRKPYFELFEEQFEQYKILCLPGAEGVGLTTALAEFSKMHGNSCITYFINGLSRLAMEPRIIHFLYYVKLSLKESINTEFIGLCQAISVWHLFLLFHFVFFSFSCGLLLPVEK